MVLLIILLIVATGIAIYSYYQYQKLSNKIKDNKWFYPTEEEKTHLQQEYNQSLIENARQVADLEIQRQNARVDTQKLIIDEQIRLLNEQFEQLRLKQMQVYYDEMQQYNQWAGECQTQASAELKVITDKIDDARAKQETINQEILRRKELEEKEDFYKVILSESDQHDIEILESIRSQLNKQQNLDKMIYDTYVNKPTQEMIKRVLNGNTPSGIYKITRLKTGEIYIGKSTNIKDRWKQHAATAFNCGTIAHSQLHTTIEKDGLQNFTFELLEEVPKDKLGEREKYWIQFYDSKKYGLNERVG